MSLAIPSFVSIVLLASSFLIAPFSPAAEEEAWRSLRHQIRDTSSFRLGVPSQVQLLGDGQTLLFHRSLPPSKSLEVFTFDLKSGREQKLLGAEQFSTAGSEMGAEEKALRERLRLQTGGINLVLADPKGEKLLVPLQGKLFVYTRKSNTIKEIAWGSDPIFNPKLSPDGQWVAYVRRSNIYVARLDGGVERALTRGGNEAKSYGVADFIAQEELDRRDGFWWSPDSRTLLIQEVDQREVERLVISDPARPDAEPQRPYYPRPGGKNAKVRFGFVSILGGDPRWIHSSRVPFEYVAGVRWEREQPTLQLLDREQKKGTLVRADPLSLKMEVLLEERDPAWVEMDGDFPQWLPGQQQFIWSSEASGQKILELRDGKGRFIRALHPSDFGYQQWVGMDQAGRKILVLASDRPESSSLYEIDIVRGEARLVHELSEGQVGATMLKKSEIYLLRSSHLQGEEQLQIRSFDGTIKHELPILTPQPLMKPQVKIETSGVDKIRVAIVRPTNFDPKLKYPVLENAYGGPGSQMVRSNGRSYLSDQVLADALGAIVVRIDSRGTPGRGRDWERAISGKFGSLPLKEHATTLLELFARYPEMDSERVGVYGWSYGGYFAAYAALARPDVYKTAVVGAPPVDWRDYDTAYTERYLGLPQEAPEAYEASSLLNLLRQKVTQARRPLLVIHGSADDNVFFFNSLKLIDALEKQAHPYEFMPLMGMTHMISDPRLDDRRFDRMLQFFRRTLLEPTEGRKS